MCSMCKVYFIQISCPLDYRLWQQTMYCNFGQKWSKLHHGQLWGIAFSAQSSDSSHDTGDNRSCGRNPIQVCTMLIVSKHNELVHFMVQAPVNIPGISERTIRQDIASSEIHTSSQIQVCMETVWHSSCDDDFQGAVLDEAARTNPDAWWWLKADGCDITKGLKESVELQWSGDVDLNDGALQEQYEVYKKRLTTAEKAGLNRSEAVEDLENILQDLVKDLDFVHSGIYVLCIATKINFMFYKQN